jgi:hypothetical protein
MSECELVRMLLGMCFSEKFTMSSLKTRRKKIRWLRMQFLGRKITRSISMVCVFQLIRHILPSMMKHNHGHIITMLGSTALVGCGNFSDICTAKFGLVGLMESLDHELTIGECHLVSVFSECAVCFVQAVMMAYTPRRLYHIISPRNYFNWPELD